MKRVFLISSRAKHAREGYDHRHIDSLRFIESLWDGDCGPDSDPWDFKRVSDKIKEEERQSTTLVLPLATIGETGNHIAQARAKKYETAQALAEIIVKAAEEKTPWAAFTAQSELWNEEGLKKLAAEWHNLVAQKIYIGDATIKTVAEYYVKMGYAVEIVTGDGGLKAYEPPAPPATPRRSRSG